MPLRKVFLIFLSVFILSGLLAGCSHPTGPSPTGSSAQGTEPLAAPAQPMYSEILASAFDADNGRYSLDSNAAFEDGVLVINTENYKDIFSLLSFTDRETRQKVILCNRPNCLHQDDSCNAFFYAKESMKMENDGARFPILENSDGYVFLKNDVLYVVDSFGDITAMAPDGTDRRVLATLDSKYSVEDAFFYRDSIFFCAHSYPPAPKDTEWEFTDEDLVFSLLEWEISSGKIKELFTFPNEPDTKCMGLYQDRAFFYYRSANTLSSASTQEEAARERDSHDTSLYCYDLRDPQRSYLKEAQKSDRLDSAAFDRDSIYYHDRKEEKLFRIRLDTGETEEIASGIGGYLELYPPVVDGKLFFMKDNTLANAFSDTPKENEYYAVDLTDKTVTATKKD